MNSPTPRAHGLDTLRSLAILSVILFHAHSFHGDKTFPEFLVPASRFFWMGVDLFFVLSGYLIATQFFRPYLAGRTPGLWAFYRNRLFRVIPAYAVVLILYLILPVWREDTNLPPLWQMLTFTQNLIIYRDLEAGVEIVAVTQGAREIPSFLRRRAR